VGSIPDVSIRVVLADDSVEIRNLLVGILDRSPEIDVVAIAQDEPTLVAAIERTRPNVVVTDVRMPPTGTDEGVRVAAYLARTQPHIGVVIVSQYSDPGWLSRVFDEESVNRGWVMKERVHVDGQLISAVKTVHQGERWVDPSVMAPE
jgi:DNA-binding NarL/FixJ family response regulator